jgi:hypothetical protein
MSNRDDNKDPVISSLHPQIYVALVGFALWFALAVWGFAGPGEVDYLLVIVSGFVCIVVALQLIMSRVPRADHAPAEDAADAQPLRRWLRATFATEQDQLTGTEAATLILLPIAAGAIGMTLFGIIFHVVEMTGI